MKKFFFASAAAFSITCSLSSCSIIAQSLVDSVFGKRDDAKAYDKGFHEPYSDPDFKERRRRSTENASVQLN